MRLNILRFLSCSIFLLFINSCKKQKGDLHDFPRGRFDYIFSWNLHDQEETLTGEVSGPYQKSGNYEFQIRPQVNMEYRTIRLGSYSDIFRISLLNSDIASDDISVEKDSDNLNVKFRSGDTLEGFFKLTRKE